MDNYLASRDLKDSSGYYFNLNFDLLTGCQFSCTGCHVDKEAPVVLTAEGEDTLLKVMASTEEGMYKPFIAFIGPTDFLVADNTVEILSHPTVVKVLSYFKRLSFQSTFLNTEKTGSIAEVLKRYYPDHELELNILIEPDKIENIKYLNTLERNQKIVHEAMDWPTPIRHFGIMNVFDYSKTKLAEFLSDYEYMHERVQHLFETTIDFNFSIGRKERKLSNEEFRQSTEMIRDLFNGSVVSKNKGQFLRFSFGKLNDSLIERQYNWSDGKFYSSPLLYERYVSFVEELEIPMVTKSYKDFEDFDHANEMRQYEYLSNTDECSECPFSATCITRGILTLMENHDIKDCLISKDAVWVINHMGTLPNHT